MPSGEQTPDIGMRTFWIVWSGQLVSALGTGLTSWGLGVWVYKATSSATLFTLIALAATLPGLLVAPLAGAYVDRWDRRKTMIGCDLLLGLIIVSLAGLLYMGKLLPWHVMITAALSSTVQSFHTPAYMAAISTIVPKDQLGRASGLVQTGQALGDIISPILGGVLIVTIGLQGLIIIDFFTFIFAVTTQFMIRFPKLERGPVEESEKTSIWSEIREGWQFIHDRKGLLWMLYFFSGINFVIPFAGVLFTPLVLSFAKEQSLGIIQTVGGIGMLVGSMLMAAWGGPKERRVRGLIGGTALLALAFASCGFRANVPWIACSMFLMMFSVPILNASSQAIWMIKTPQHLQGRVYSVRRMLAQGSAPLAFLLSGRMADVIFEPSMREGGALSGTVGTIIGVGPGRGIGLMFCAMGILTFVLTAFAYVNPHIRNVEREVPDAPLLSETAAT